MTRKNVSDRIAIDVCLALESALGLFSDCQFLASDLSIGVRRSFDDSPLGEEYSLDPVPATVARIRLSVEAVLLDNSMGTDWIARVGPEIDAAIGRSLHAERRS